MIISFTLNPGLDYILQIEELAMNETQRAKKAALYAAGKGINVSRMLARFALPTIAMGFIGGINGERFTKILEQENITLNFVPCKKETRMNVIITKLGSYDQLRISTKGSEIHRDELNELYKRIDNLPEEVKYVTFGGSLPQGVPNSVYKDLIELIQSRGIKCVLDTSGKPLIEGIKAKPFLIKPNLHELSQITGKELEKLSDIKEEAVKLVQKGVKNVIVSFASGGAIFVNEKKILHAFAPKVEVKSKVGAGDSMVAGILYGFHKNLPEEEILRYGIAFGSAAVLTTGTELAYKKEVHDLYEKVDIKSSEDIC